MNTTIGTPLTHPSRSSRTKVSSF